MGGAGGGGAGEEEEEEEAAASVGNKRVDVGGKKCCSRSLRPRTLEA
jgi:hypothetical protein